MLLGGRTICGLKSLKWIYQHTLNSVWFGITMMVLVGLYIAVGSGMTSVRAAFEMSDLEFFAAWPLKLLMVLLVLNLTCVTLERIPLTPPRYGVWCVHAGIITLILGMATYYNRKIEGTTLIPVGQTATRFYDNQMRMLYVRLNDRDASAHTLPGLPRFHSYPVSANTEEKFAGWGLTGLEPMYQRTPVGQIAGLKDPLYVDIIGYYPYAQVIDQFVEGRGGNQNGVKITLNAPFMGTSEVEYVVAGDSQHSTTMAGSSEVRLIELGSAEGIAEVVKSAATAEARDPFRLLPKQGAERHTLLGLSGSKELTDVSVAKGRGPVVTKLESGAGEVSVMLGQMKMKAKVERVEGLLRDEHVEEVPASQRTRQGGESGLYQVVVARVRSGGWSAVVPVPFSQYALEPVVQWTGGRVTLPGGNNMELQLQLSNEFLPLPADITLNQFELVHYPGGDERTSLQRDFKSHLTMRDPGSGKMYRGVAHMNHPVYWAGGDWLFFQAAWDMDGQRWTILGVGNRPGVWVMTIGFLMIFFGVGYAFYIKPIIIRRMKAGAIEKAKRVGKKKVVEMAGV